MKECRALIEKNTGLASDYYLIKLAPDKPAECAVMPGQFAMIGLDSSESLLLRRPFSVFDCESGAKGSLSFFYKVAGKGTLALSKAPRGTSVSLLYPLGNGFDCSTARDRTLCIVTGGIGMAPFYLLMKRIKQYNPREVYLFYGAKTRREFFFGDFFKKACSKLYFSTDDGSKGTKGFIHELFERELGLRKGPLAGPDKEIVVYTCGPRPMMRKVAQICGQRGIACYASMEEMMGCGFGACFSCVVKSREQEGKYLTVCKDGPVFEGATIEI